MTPTSPERSRGDRWAARMQQEGWWVQKMPASSMAGVPDWLMGRPKGTGTVWVEAKTLEAVLGARGKKPAAACSGAQRFFLDRARVAGDNCAVLILGEEGYLLLNWKDARKPISSRLFGHTFSQYRVQ